jgi:hypothetical protein
MPASMERLERAPVDVPVQLLADERQVDELDERRLQLAAGLGAVVIVECPESDVESGLGS